MITRTTPSKTMSTVRTMTALSKTRNAASVVRRCAGMLPGGWSMTLHPLLSPTSTQPCFRHHEQCPGWTHAAQVCGKRTQEQPGGDHSKEWRGMRETWFQGLPIGLTECNV